LLYFENCSVSGMDIGQIAIKPYVTQKEKLLLESRVHSYLTIYQSSLSLPFCLLFLFSTSSCEPNSSHNFNNLHFGSYLAMI